MGEHRKREYLEGVKDRKGRTRFRALAEALEAAQTIEKDPRYKELFMKVPEK